MATIGDAMQTLILAKSVQLYARQESDQQTPDDQLALLRSIEMPNTHPEQRTPHGAARVYTHAAPDIAVTFTLSASSDVFVELLKWSLLDANGVLPSRKWQFRCTDINGTTKNLTVTGVLRDFTPRKGFDDEAQPVEVDGFIRVTDTAMTLT